MKFQNIRRVGVLVFVLFLALTLTLVLTAPAWAEAEGGGGDQTENTSPEPTPTPKPAELWISNGGSNVSGDTVIANVGDTVMLRPQWDTTEGRDPVPSGVSYRWTMTVDGKEPDGVAFVSPVNTPNNQINIAAWKAVDNVTVTVTAVTGNNNVRGTSSCTLKVREPVWTIKSNVAAVSGDPPRLNLKIGEKSTLTVELSRISSDITNQDIIYTFESSNTNVLAIDETDSPDSPVRATAKAAGTATVTITAILPYDNYPDKSSPVDWGLTEKDQLVLGTKTLTVNVGEPKLNLTVNESKLKIGQKATLTVNCTENLPSGKITYQLESSDGTVVKLEESTVSPTGSTTTATAEAKVTALKKGTATVTVTMLVDNVEVANVKAECSLTVEGATWKVYDANDEKQADIGTELNLQIGDSIVLVPEVSNLADGVSVTKYTYKSSNDKIVTVSSNGELKAIATGGPVTITIIPTGLAEGIVIEPKTLTVNVSQSTLNITENDIPVTARSLNIGESVTLKAALKDVSASSGVTYKWAIDVEGVVTPLPSTSTSEASVTGIKAGEVQITVQAIYGDNLIGEAKCTLTIVGPKLTMEIEKDGGKVPSLPTMQIGETAKLTVQYDSSTAPVDGKGNAIAPKSYEWKCTTEDGKKSDVVEIDPITGENVTITGENVTITASKPGTAIVTVTATWENASATYDVKIAVAGPSLSIASADGTVYDEDHPLELGVKRDPVTLTAKLVDGPTDSSKVTYTWTVTETPADGKEAQDTEKVISLLPENNTTDTAEVTAENTTDNKVTITVTAKWGDTAADQISASCKVTVLAPVEKVELNKSELTLKVHEKETLVATVSPENALNKNVTWSSGNEKIATVDELTGEVTGVAEGTTVITAKVVDGGKEFTATCEVTVKPATITGIVFGTSSPIIWAKGDPTSWDLSVALRPDGAKLEEGEKLKWSVTINDGDPKNPLKLSGAGLTVSNDGLTATGAGLTARLTIADPGIYTVTVCVVSDGKEGEHYSIEVIVSGITLTRREAKLLVDQSTTVTVKAFGFAESGTTTDVDWSSSDPSVVFVTYGEMTGRKLGEAVVTATKNGYTAECVVNVTEDSEAIANNGGRGYMASPGDPLNLGEVWAELNQISKNKTGDRNENDEPVGNGSPLAFITNVAVPTSQGTLYYNYSSEASPGDGIRLTDRFAKSPDSTQKRIDLLYFVPKQGFKGTAEITFIGWAKDGTSFSGVIKVNVSGTEESISYRTQAGVPIYFQTDDFDAFCRNLQGRGVNYITFDLPPASQGVLYYNYLAGEGIRVSASTRFSLSGRYIIGGVCFVPNASFVGEVTIKFHGMDTAGRTFSGKVVVNVISSGISSGGHLSGERGQPVTFQSSLFNNACREAINDTLSFVTFKLPALEEGILYYNYRGAGNFESRVNPTTRYFFSGVPGINNVAFVPASNAAGRIAISYTGYGMSGNTFDGTLYIDLGGVDPIYYFAAKNNAVNFDEDDFINAGLYQLDAKVSYVIFTGMSDTGLGRLYYNRTSSASGRTEINPSAASGSRYYVSPSSSQNGLGRVSFRAGNGVGSVTITYAAYDSSNNKLFESDVIIQVGSLTPVDTGLSCTTGRQAGLSGSALSSACRPAMSESLSYIEITSVPDPAVGYLYLNYFGFGTGTVVKPGDLFYYAGSPGISRLSFVPHAGFTGEAEITYIGYSSGAQEQVSGRVIVNVTRSERSQYFNDMAGYEWAIDSVDYLRQNRAVEGVGNNNYAPGLNVTRGDFILMLVRAYGFTANGSASYYDVSASDYYAEAVRVATVLGIVQGYGGYFNPTSPISRQDAMVMIFRALKASGMTITNGLAANLSVFYDRGQIDSYALEALGSLVQMRVVEGDGNGYLRPQGMLNRAEAAKLLHTIMTL